MAFYAEIIDFRCIFMQKVMSNARLFTILDRKWAIFAVFWA